MTSTAQKPALSVFDFTDYRTFLFHWFEAKKQQNPRWSYAVWARQLGLKSPSGIHMVLGGKRVPNAGTVRKFIRHLGLDEREAEYFSDLIQLRRAEGDPRLSVLLMERLAKHHTGEKFLELDPQRFAAISQWYYYAIRELVRMPLFREDPAWIASCFEFRISIREVESAMRTLIKLKLLERDAGGRLVAASVHLETRSDVADEGLKRFHEQALENAKQSLRSVPPPEREITGTTFALSRANLAKAKALVRRFQNELCDLVENPEGDVIYHLELALYPLWRPRD